MGINKIKRKSAAVIALTIALMTAALLTISVGATNHTDSDTTNLSQTISSGTITTEIRDAGGSAVASPQVNFTPLTTPPLVCETTTATLGTLSERIYVDNPDATSAGWTLTIAATDGPTATWSGDGNTYDFNDPTNAGCDAGQMTVNPSSADSAITPDCESCDDTGLSLGSESAFDEETEDEITLISADATSDNVGMWYLTGVDLSQTVPAGQNADTYTLDMTITVTAN